MKKLLNTLYVTNPNAYLCKQDGALTVKVDGKQMLQLPFHILESVVIFGYLGCSPALLGECNRQGISVVFLDELGRLLARVEGPISGNVLLRKAQYRLSENNPAALELSKRFILAKLHNSRIVLQRFARDYPDACDESTNKVIGTLREQGRKVQYIENTDQLRGFEGDAAHSYFSVFNRLLLTDDEALQFSGRSRRPPLDPVNAMLSLFYSILSRDIASACESVGLDPQVGFFHTDRSGRASLALDIMEELRAYYVDRFVLSLFNRKQFVKKDFDFRGSQGVYLSESARKEVLELWQNRKKEQITHPFLKEKMPLGLLPFIQVQLLSRFLRGDLDDYPAFLWR